MKQRKLDFLLIASGILFLWTMSNVASVPHLSIDELKGIRGGGELTVLIEGPPCTVLYESGTQPTITLTSQVLPEIAQGGTYKWEVLEGENIEKVGSDTGESFVVRGVSESSEREDNTIQLTYKKEGYNDATATHKLTVQKPSSLRIEGEEVSWNPLQYIREITYQILDQFDDNVQEWGTAQLKWSEELWIIQSESGAGLQPPAQNEPVDSDGTFIDTLTLPKVKFYPPPVKDIYGQKIWIKGWFVRENEITFSSDDSGYSIQVDEK